MLNFVGTICPNETDLASLNSDGDDEDKRLQSSGYGNKQTDPISSQRIVQRPCMETA